MYFGIGSQLNPGSALRTMGILSNTPLLSLDYMLEMRVDKEIAALDEVSFNAGFAAPLLV
jgi:hypothetical protein